MKIGLFAPALNPTATPEYLRTLGRGAEERGFHEIWVAEHVVLFDEYESEYPYSSDGKIPAGGESGILDPFNTLSFLAAVTDRIRLGTGICLVPQRNPVYTAKDVATLDWVAGGRVDFGVGIGWLAEEFQAVAAPFDKRAARCRSYLEVMKRLWRDPVSEYRDEFYDLRPCRMYPKPVQAPHPPIYFGGESEPALRRVADLGQGWYPFKLLPEQLAKPLTRLDGLLSERGRSLGDIDVVVCPYMLPIDLDAVKRYRDLGVSQVILLLIAPDVRELESTMDRLAETFVVPGAGI
jgi:probable F420-dependent oxidoreductase